MKKIFILFFMILGLNILFADLIVNVPFEPDQVGPAYETEGNYVFDCGTFYVTNTGETETFTINVTTEGMPAPWSMLWCHGALCYMVGWGPWYEEIQSGEEFDIHTTISIYDMAGSFTYQFYFNSESLTEPVLIDFSFATEDALNSDEEVAQNSFKLSQNYPNPFNPANAGSGRSPETTITYNLTENEAANSVINIYNIKGQLIYTFNHLQAGKNNVFWNGKDRNNKSVVSGIYFYKLEGQTSSKLKKMILLR